MYEKKVYHRDIKPENILVHNGVPKIADFGFAQAINEKNPEIKTLTSAVGTPYYMAPQILGGEKYSIKCDVWSLGIVFYQILFGLLPWTENSSISALFKEIKN